MSEVKLEPSQPTAGIELREVVFRAMTSITRSCSVCVAKIRSGAKLHFFREHP